MMQTAHQTPARELGQDITEAIVGVPRCRCVVEGQHGASERLDQKREQGHAPEHLVPSAGCRNLLVKKLADRRMYTGPMVQPPVDAVKQAHALFSGETC